MRRQVGALLTQPLPEDNIFYYRRPGLEERSEGP